MNQIKPFIEHLPWAVFTGLAAWYVTDNPVLILVALVTGWLIDVDHLIDYGFYLFHGAENSLHDFVSGAYFAKSDKIFVLAHAWEWVGVWLLAWGVLGHWEIGLTGAVSLTGHLIQDQLTNRVYTGTDASRSECSTGCTTPGDR